MSICPDRRTRGTPEEEWTGSSNRPQARSRKQRKAKPQKCPSAEEISAGQDITNNARRFRSPSKAVTC